MTLLTAILFQHPWWNAAEFSALNKLFQEKLFREYRSYRNRERRIRKRFVETGMSPSQWKIHCRLRSALKRGKSLHYYKQPWFSKRHCS